MAHLELRKEIEQLEQYVWYGGTACSKGELPGMLQKLLCGGLIFAISIQTVGSFSVSCFWVRKDSLMNIPQC